jgi:hypothetical protein
MRTSTSVVVTANLPASCDEAAQGSRAKGYAKVSEALAAVERLLRL